MNVSMISGSIFAMGNTTPPQPTPFSFEDAGKTPFSIGSILPHHDTDVGGGVSADAVHDSCLSRLISEDLWSELDADSDGTLSKSELKSFRDIIVESRSSKDSTPPPPEADPAAMFKNLLTSGATSQEGINTFVNVSNEAYAALKNLLSSLEA